MTATAEGLGRGRPRDPQIDTLVIRATLELLVEVGFAETTIQAVARRAGVGAPAIYRRWANRIELIESAIFPTMEIPSVSPTGDLRTDLQHYVDVYTQEFGGPAARVALPALLSTYQSDPERNRTVSDRVGAEVRDAFRELLRTAPPEAVDPSVDPDDVLDLLIGAVLYRVFLLPFTGREERDDRTADLALRALRPTPKKSTATNSTSTNSTSTTGACP